MLARLQVVDYSVNVPAGVQKNCFKFKYCWAGSHICLRAELNNYNNDN